MKKPIQLRRSQAVLAAKVVTQPAGRFIKIMNQCGVLRGYFRYVMIDNEPIRPIKPLFKRKIRNPA